jgi:integrase
MGRPKLGYHLRRDRGDRCYLRVDGFADRFAFDTRNPTTAQIADALAQIRSNGKAETPKPSPADQDSLRAVADAYYKSRQFLKNIDPTTQTARRNAIEALLRTKTATGMLRAHGKVYDLTRKHVLAIQGECFDKPETGNIRVKILRYLYAFAIDAEWPGVTGNPAREVKLLPPAVKTTPEGAPYVGHREWTLPEAERFLDFHRDDADACLTVNLLLYTGARVSDLRKVGRVHETMIDWRGTKVRCLKFRVTKGSGKRARVGKAQVDAVVPIVPQLAAVLARLPADRMVYLHHSHGRPWRSAKSLGERVKKWRDAIVDDDGSRPFADLSCHGLRKASADWWVKTYRCSTHELMAIFGWLTEKEALHYTAGYDREDSAAGVVVKFPARA